jgi:SWI/SNF-related matrix-associated actin-dependent regulator of chromatin subfamily A-like protein 1
MPFIYEQAGRYVAACLYQDRELPINAGFKFSIERKQFWSTDPRVAYRLYPYCHKDVQNYLDEYFKDLLPKKYAVDPIKLTASVAFKRQVKRYQVRGALHILRNSSSYLWYEAGTGKTATATLALEYLSKRNFINVVFCPSGLTTTWREEIDRVSRTFLDIHILEDKKDRPRLNADVIIVPDSLVTADLLTYFEGANLGACIIDEGHRLKNATAGRTKALTERAGVGVNKLVKMFKHICVMSGTPLPNYKPIEMYAVLNAFAPWAIGFMNRIEYGVRYCGTNLDDTFLSYDGAENVDELIRTLKLSGYLIYQELPVEDVAAQAEDEYIYLGGGSSAVYKAEQDLRGKLPLEEILKLSLDKSAKITAKYNFHARLKGEEYVDARDFMAELRQLAGLDTAAEAVPILSDVLKYEGVPVVVFAWHREVIARLKVGLEKYDPLVIDGSVKDKQSVVRDFQESKTPRPIIVQIAAGGTGFTLTKAYKCYFVEFSYVDGENEQAVRRLRRHGQKNAVLPSYFVFKNSLAHTVLGILNKKQINKTRFISALKKE